MSKANNPQRHTPISGVYIHIPYCIQLCPYCDFNKVTRKSVSRSLFERYQEALCIEIRSYLSRYASRNIHTLYFGGGTPSLYPVPYIRKLLECLKKSGMPENLKEVTLEVDPKTIRRHSLEQLKASGINRISIGAQTFQDDLLIRLGRYHRQKDIKECFEDCRITGFDNISVDLMLGIPGQTMAHLMNDLELLTSLNPEHVSMYHLNIHRGTPWNRVRRSLDLPVESLQLKLHKRATSAFRKMGIHQYEISNFSRPGFQSRHNTDCWSLKGYLGFGAGASSYDGQKRWQNVKALEIYVKNTLQKGNAKGGVEKLTERDHKIEYVMLSLRKSAGFSLAVYEKQFGKSVFDDFPDLAVGDIMNTLVGIRGGRIRLTAKGRLLSNEVLQALF